MIGAENQRVRRILPRGQWCDVHLKISNAASRLAIGFGALALKYIHEFARKGNVQFVWLAQHANGDIATILGISESTVKKHLLEIFAVLGVETRSAATLRALEVLANAR